MSIFARVSALVVLALGASVPFAGCSSATSSNCSSYCKASLACVTPERCTFVDPGAAEDACVAMCEAGFEGLTADETKAINDCFACIAQQNPGDTCLEQLDNHTCDAVCDTSATEAAGEKWSNNLEAQPAPEGGLCTNGRNGLAAGSSCEYGSDGSTCTVSCCNGKCGATPDVGVECDETATPSMCTCTAGKNKGKTFTSENACDGNDAWNQCNQ